MHEPEPFSPMELEAMRAAVEPTPPTIDDTPSPAPPPAPERRPRLAEKCMQCGGPNTNTCSDLCPTCVGGVPAAAEVVSLPATIAVGEPVNLGPVVDVQGLKDQISTLEGDLAASQREAARARSSLSEATNRNGSYQRAIKEAEAEFRQAAIHVDDSLLQNFPGQLSNFIRRLARAVRDIGPERDALRAEVKRLNAEIFEFPRKLEAKDQAAVLLQKKIDLGRQREKALETTAETMQLARDKAEADRDKAVEEKNRTERQVAGLRAKVAELEGAVSKLQTSAKPEAKVA